MGWPMAAGAAASGASAPAGNFRPRVLLAGLLAAVVALVGAGILALARPPGEADRPGAGRLRQTSDATRLAEALREPGLDVVSTVSLRNDTILVDPPYDILSRIDVGSAASIASRALGGDAVVRCRFGILSMTAMIRGTYEQAVPVWMCVQVAPVLFLAGGVPRRLVAVSFVHAVDGHRFLEIREPA